MPEKKPIESQPSLSSNSEKSPVNTLGDILSRIVTKIRDEPFLFVIAVVILLIMLVVLGKDLVSPDLRFIVIGIIVLAIVVIYGYYSKGNGTTPPKKNSSGTDQNPPIPDLLTFEKMELEFCEILDRLENGKGMASFKERGDLPRLLNGLYSGLLYTSLALVKGHIDPLFYGNLMEWDENKKLLRLRYLSGPYNESLINKEFPVNDPQPSVAITAFIRGENKIMNSMELEARVKGERLQAMISIPIEQFEKCKPGAIAILNIDSAEKGVFPSEGSDDYLDMNRRIDKLKKLLQRVNNLRWKFMQALK